MFLSDLIENHYDRVCETLALSVLSNKRPSSVCATNVFANTGVKGRRRLVSCPGIYRDLYSPRSNKRNLVFKKT